MRNNNTLYKNVLEHIEANIFEELCEVLLRYKFPQYNIQFPIRNKAGQDGGEDAYSDKEGIKYAFSIQENWKDKVGKGIKKYIKHNNKQPETKKRNKLIYVTNKKITEPEWNKFCAQNKNLKENTLHIERIELNTLLNYMEKYFQHNNDPELYYKLGLSNLSCNGRSLQHTTWGLDLDTKKIIN